jgi:hypothetical protein
MSLFLRTSGSEASQPAFKHFTRILREIERRALLSPPRSPNKRSETAGNLFEHSLFHQHSFTNSTRLVHQRR